MQRPIYIQISGSQQRQGDDFSSRLAWSFLGLAFAAILFAGTFPFDFAIPGSHAISEIARRWDWTWNPYDPGYVDRKENLFFMTPLGLGLAAVCRQRRWGVGWTLLAAFLGSMATSFLVEVSQTFVSFRDPSWADVWCNTLGATIAAAVYEFAGGQRGLHWIGQRVGRLYALLTFRTMVAVTSVYCVLQLVTPLMLHASGELDGWDLNMPLLVGNETSGDRGWSGIVSEVDLGSRAATAEQAKALSDEQSAAAVLGDDLLASYTLTGQGPYGDAAAKQQPLTWTGTPPDTETEMGVVVSPAGWLRTAKPLFAAINQIRARSQFTLHVKEATLDTGPRDILPPYRLVSISQGVSQRDLTIGQESGDLVIRVRTAVAAMPDLYLKDGMADKLQHDLVVTAANGSIVAYVDGYERGRCEITPEAKMIWRLYPRGGFRIYIDHYGYRSYAILYRLIVMLPLALLLIVTTRRWKAPRVKKRWACLGAVVAMTLALELVITIQGGSSGEWKNVLVSLVIGSIALVPLTKQAARKS